MGDVKADFIRIRGRGIIGKDKSLNIIADNGTSTFQGNYVQVGEGEKDYQAIWVGSADATLTFDAKNNGEIFMYDNVSGTDGYKVNIQGMAQVRCTSTTISKTLM